MEQVQYNIALYIYTFIYVVVTTRSPSLYILPHIIYYTQYIIQNTNSLILYTIKNHAIYNFFFQFYIYYKDRFVREKIVWFWIFLCVLIYLCKAMSLYTGIYMYNAYIYVEKSTALKTHTHAHAQYTLDKRTYKRLTLVLTRDNTQWDLIANER